MIHALLLAALVLPANAETLHLNEISFNMGRFTPRVTLTIDGQDDLASPGLAYGAQYLRQTSSHAAFGIGFEKLNPLAHNSMTVITHGLTTSNFESFTFMGLAKFSTSGALRLYLMGGLGLHSTTLKIDMFPLAGYVWLDTGTKDKALPVLRTALGLI